MFSKYLLINGEDGNQRSIDYFGSSNEDEENQNSVKKSLTPIDIARIIHDHRLEFSTNILQYLKCSCDSDNCLGIKYAKIYNKPFITYGDIFQFFGDKITYKNNSFHICKKNLIMTHVSCGTSNTNDKEFKFCSEENDQLPEINFDPNMITICGMILDENH